MNIGVPVRSASLFADQKSISHGGPAGGSPARIEFTGTTSRSRRRICMIRTPLPGRSFISSDPVSTCLEFEEFYEVASQTVYGALGCRVPDTEASVLEEEMHLPLPCPDTLYLVIGNPALEFSGDHVQTMIRDDHIHLLLSLPPGLGAGTYINTLPQHRLVLYHREDLLTFTQLETEFRSCNKTPPGA